MQESHFHHLADSWLTASQDALEDADTQGVLDVDCEQGALTIALQSGAVYVVSKHAPSCQLWLSSPVSGGLHFAYDESSGAWRLPDGRTLPIVLSQELETATGMKVEL